MPDLVLLPTALEFDHVAPRIRAVADEREWKVERCGFGPIIAAARASQLIARHRPKKVLLVGIAGSFLNDDSIATAYRFDCVISHGVGVGESSHFISAAQLGWPQWSDPDPLRQIEDVLWLTETGDRGTDPKVLLTACAGASTAAEASQRRARFPGIVAEDMEGFGVAAAARLAGVSVGIIRGMSNRVGDRDHRNWQVTAALDAAAELAKQAIAEA